MRHPILVALALAAVGCGGGSESTPVITSPPIPTVDLTIPTSIVAVSQSNINLIGGQSTNVTVKVLNAKDAALSGVIVNFAATGGVVGTPSLGTGADGTATAKWTPAAVPGQQVFTASIPSTSLAATFVVLVTIPFTGTWSGVVGSQVLTLVLLENAGAVSGTGTLTGTPTGTRALTASGTLLGQTLNVSLSSGTIQPFILKATITTSGVTMAGTLTGSGFTGDAITLTKAP